MIEDFSHQPEAEEEEATKKERKWFFNGNFLDSWLNKEVEEESDEESEENEALPIKATRKFKDFFKNLVGLELVPKVFEPVKETYSSNEKMAGYEENLSEEIEGGTLDSEPEGLLVIPHDELDEIQTEDYSESASVLVGSPGRESKLTSRETVELLSEPAVSINRQTEKSTAFSTGEILKKEKEKLLKRKISKLQKKKNTIEKETNEIIAQQKQFERSLDERNASESIKEKLQEPTSNVLRYQAVESSERSQPVESPEVVKLKEFVSNEAKQTPEVVLDKVENAAEKDVPIENLYEKRHEIKGESGQGSSGPVFDTSQFPAKSRSYLYPSRSKDMNSSAPSAQYSPPKRSLSKKRGLYAQAAKSGFWTAIILLTLIFVVVIIF